MSGLKNLTSAQVAAIATALAGTTTTPPPPPPATTDGPTLYANNCAGCHGSLATSTKIGRTAAQITAAISSVSAMSGLKSLTSAQVAAIATALAAQTPPPPVTDGPTLYAQNCQSCHGALASSEVRGASASKIQQAINSKSQMAGLKSLTTTQIQAIAAALSGRAWLPSGGPQSVMYASMEMDLSRPFRVVRYPAV
jgi:mono/diheme cytochrome c family protein